MRMIFIMDNDDTMIMDDNNDDTNDYIIMG